MSPAQESHDLDSLLLERFGSSGRIRFLSYAGGGGPGYVFKVRIDQRQYALKLVRSMNELPLRRYVDFL